MSLSRRQWLLLAANYDEVPRRQPRFTAWRRDWVHAMQTWQAPPELAADLPSVLLDDRGLSVVLLDAAKGRGRASLELRTALVACLREAGYTYVSLDLVGYRTGAMNEVPR